MKFRIVYLSDEFGIPNESQSQKDCSLEELSESLSPDCIILFKKAGIFEFIGFVSVHTLLFFATEFVDHTLKNCRHRIANEATICIELIRKLLHDQNSVPATELLAVRTSLINLPGRSMDCTNRASITLASAGLEIRTYYRPKGETTYRARQFEHSIHNVFGDCALEYARETDIWCPSGDKKWVCERNRQGTFILNFFGVE